MAFLEVNPARKGAKINRNIYGHFSEHLGRCIYNGMFVGENSPIPNVNGMRTDVVEALKQIRVPVLRWPGGCFADEYHWKDGIGPKEGRKRMVNTHWGGVVEDNSFGTHEFMELCRQIGCEPYVNGNVGSGTVQEMSEWVEYMTFDGVSPMAELRKQNGREEPWKLTYFGVGNESWGCGGNMRPEYYADLFRRYATYVRNYGDNKVFKIACGPNVDDYEWTDNVMEIAGKYADAISLHYYTRPRSLAWDDKGPATGFEEKEYWTTLRNALWMNELVENHLSIMRRHDPEGRVGLIVDEWGTWYDVEPGTNPGFLYQQNTMRDALVAAVTLNIFNRHADGVIMANLAQIVNVLQSVILTEGEKMLLTPTYHVFDLYKEHQDATLLDSYVESHPVGDDQVQIASLHQSASMDAEGRVHITVANLSLSGEETLTVRVPGKENAKASVRVLSGSMDAHNTFEAPEMVKPVSVTDFRQENGVLTVRVPACSVTAITLE